MPRNHKISVPFSSEELEKIKRTATGLGLSMCSYCRFIILNSHLSFRELEEEITKI